MLPFHKLRFRLRNYVGKNNLPLPLHIVDLAEILNSGLWRGSLNYVIVVEGDVRGSMEEDKHQISVTKVTDKEGYSHVLFYVKTFVQECSDASLYFADGTFKVVPRIKGPCQLLTLSCEKYDQVRNMCSTI